MNRGRSRRASTWSERTRARYVARREQLLEDAQVRRGSRKRGLVLGAGALVALGSMYQLVAADVLAVNFTTMNSSFQLYTNYLQGEKVAAYLNTTSRQDGVNVPVAEVGVKQASLSGLCMIESEDLPGPLGTYSLVLTAGDKVDSAFSTQSGLPTSDPNYYLPTGWSSGTDVWGTNGDASKGQYVGALKGSRAANAVKTTDLFFNSSSVRGNGYKVSGLYLGERAQDVGPSAGITWASGLGSKSPAEATSGGFGLRVDHLNLAGAQLWTDGSPVIPGTPAVPDTPATDPTTVVTSDGPATVVGVEAANSTQANLNATGNTKPESIGSLVDGLPWTSSTIDSKWLAPVSPTSTAPVVATQTLSQRVRVSSYQIWSANDTPARDPKDWTVQGSDDKSTWTTIDKVTGNSFDARNSVYDFKMDTPGYYKYYRLTITANNGDSNTQMSEWKLSDVGLLNSTISNSAYAGVNGENVRFLADGAVDSSNQGTKWYYDFGTSFPGVSVMYTMYAPTKATTYSLRAASDSGSNTQRNPRDWTVQGSNDPSAAANDAASSSKWTTLDTETGQTSNLGNNSVRTYTIPAAKVGSYKYYRINITAMNGTQTNVFSQVYRMSLADWLLGTSTTTLTIPGTPFIPGSPAGPDTPAVPAGGSAYGLQLKGSISLPKLKLKVVPGAQTQSYCPTAAG